MASFASNGYRSKISSIVVSLRTRLRTSTLLHRQGSLPEPTNCNVHMEHIYTHIIFEGCLSSSLSFLFCLCKMQFWIYKIQKTADRILFFFCPSPCRFIIKWENSVNLMEKNTITGFDLTSFDMWNKYSYFRRLGETLMENYRWWITHRKTHFVPWMQYWELK